MVGKGGQQCCYLDKAQAPHAVSCAGSVRQRGDAHLLMAVVPYSKQVTHITYDFISVEMTEKVKNKVTNMSVDIIKLSTQTFQCYNTKDIFETQQGNMWDGKMQMKRPESHTDKSTRATLCGTHTLPSSALQCSSELTSLSVKPSAVTWPSPTRL